MPFEHGTDTMTTGMKKTLNQLGSFLLEPFNGFECFARELLMCQGQELSGMVVVGARRRSMIDLPDAGLQLWISRMVFTAVTDA